MRLGVNRAAKLGRGIDRDVLENAPGCFGVSSVLVDAITANLAGFVRSRGFFALGFAAFRQFFARAKCLSCTPTASFSAFFPRWVCDGMRKGTNPLKSP